MTWLELADGVYARRYEELDLTVGLVVGSDHCLVVDVRGDVEQGAELAAAVREITPLPWSVVYTHAHFDHAFGTTPFLPCDIWAHEGCRTELTTYGEGARRKWIQHYLGENRPEMAEALERTVITLPDKPVSDTAEIDLGGRRVVLRFLGRAHTDHDLFVHVPDAGVIYAGDAVENAEAGFSAFSFNEDSSLVEWTGVMGAILELEPKIIVAGHGAPVDTAFIEKHREGLRELTALKTAIAAGDLTTDEAVARSPYPDDVTRAALSTA
ncbi:MBL fold metallo-hydrolase [Amycolatopsis sp. BJA-103]|uniref:MBL fold metallo-hydrolase n=1 Tax=Amycolatopsis sp. BJA-103 TaxID=1911175 RepID=UPI000C78C8A5|nr:MBL fold metallo-hydrolase [Amycolatopsis sp. BJA-103]AUI57062.1 MBL fold metallo-hydrolase [Amycolatopsis sp. BJA-103]PNE15338.1 MBL fold metallo-hydrolase [Amycolatopsis sp. BJA-103]